MSSRCIYSMWTKRTEHPRKVHLRISWDDDKLEDHSSPDAFILEYADAHEDEDPVWIEIETHHSMSEAQRKAETFTGREIRQAKWGACNT